MKKTRRLICVGICAALAAGTLFAAEPTQKDAIALVEKADAFLKANNKEKLIERINACDPDFCRGDFYVFTMDASGAVTSHPYNKKLIGKAMLDVPDPDGKMFRKERIDLANNKGKGWVDYKYKNPEKNKIESKTSYVLKSGEVILSAGIYK